MDEKQAKALREPFPAALIGKLPKAGQMLDFVGHAAVTDRLLQVDPEWTWRPMARDDHGVPVVANGGLWIELTVAGVTRPGWGDGKNVKEMIGDAIRNAAMRFGVALDLWAKEDLQASGTDNRPIEGGATGADTPPAAVPDRFARPRGPDATETQRKKLLALVTDVQAFPGQDNFRAQIDYALAQLNGEGAQLGDLDVRGGLLVDRPTMDSLIERSERYLANLQRRNAA